MKVSIIVSDDHGNNYRGEVELVPSTTAPHKQVKKVSLSKTVTKSPTSFSVPIRAFVKQHARGLSGPQKFALLVAYLKKGETNKEALLTDVGKHWNKMKPLLGGKLNLAYPTRAKENGWVDSPKRGTYVLLPGWKSIFDA